MIPHWWDGQRWTCLGCGQVWYDPCACPCHKKEMKDEVVRTALAL